MKQTYRRGSGDVYVFIDMHTHKHTDTHKRTQEGRSKNEDKFDTTVTSKKNTVCDAATTNITHTHTHKANTGTFFGPPSPLSLSVFFCMS